MNITRKSHPFIITTSAVVAYDGSADLTGDANRVVLGYLDAVREQGQVSTRATAEDLAGFALRAFTANEIEMRARFSNDECFLIVVTAYDGLRIERAEVTEYGVERSIAKRIERLVEQGGWTLAGEHRGTHFLWKGKCGLTIEPSHVAGHIKVDF